ncbi:MAG: NOP5/NOP56 family protein [Nanoarchaeota archaeon]
MKYIYTSLIGSFVFDNQFQVVEKILFSPPEEYATRETKDKTSQKLRQRHPGLRDLPPEKIASALAALKNSSYYPSFYRQNLALTKQKIKASVTKDQLLIQAIANVQELDKTANLLARRLREWYGWYYPELAERVHDHEKFAELASTKTREQLMKDYQEKGTMGAGLKKEDIEEMTALAKELVNLYQLRHKHEQYLEEVMQQNCPNLLELAGATIGAKLLELAKGLKNLALLPASTIQLLGAEKALFRHITSGARSPKYGLLYQHPLVQKVKASERGKAARRLADKLSLCSRLDYFKGEFKAREYKKELEEKLKE